MAESMVERVARVLYSTFPYDGPGEKPKWQDGGNSDKQEDARFCAMAAIRAMREPTDEMVEAMVEASVKFDASALVTRYQAAIDKALEECPWAIGNGFLMPSGFG